MVTLRVAVAGRAAYGAAFVVGVPVLLVEWAALSGPQVRLPRVGDEFVGALVGLAGLCVVVMGIVTLIRRGRGLPMNVFPPPLLVRDGPFLWVRDPIYIGSGLVVLGVALAARSPSGLWLVTPTTWLAMAALTFGYERHDLRRRFGNAALTPTRLSLPAFDDSRPTAAERFSTLVLVFVPWLAAYYAVQALGRPPDAVSTLLPGESRWPVFTWMELPYASAYVFVPCTVLAARSRRALRAFAESGLVATVVVTLCWLIIPVVAVHRAFDPTGLAGALLSSEETHSNGVAAFPAFHALWPLLAARAWSAGVGRVRCVIAWSWSAIIIASCIGTGHHTVVDVAAAFALYPLVRDVRSTWAMVRRATEHVANSWREWSFGPVRFINYGLYAGAAGAVGLAIGGAASGPGRELAVVWVGLLTLIGAGAYAQILEGSSRLLRPFGWYGGLLGCVVAIITSPLVGGGIIPLMAGFALAAPWIQILGRLRCLVQGCCHGSPASESAGIRYRHRRSRVTQLADLAGVPLYPTPLYSIGGNLVIGLLLMRLRMLAAPDTLVIGVYCILSGCARFVEESYRGEPQTPIVAGLRAYQWFAFATVLAGIGITMVPSAPNASGFHRPTAALWVGSVAMFLVYAVSMGLDFPHSDRRFARLAPAD